LGLHSRYWAPDAVEHWGDVNLMKGGIILADQLTTVSPNYARQIRMPEYGAGLDGILRSLSFKLTGILNGIDVEEWDPETDPHIASNYSRERLNGKALSKRALLKEMKLRFAARTPLYGTVPVVRLTGGLADTVFPCDGANLDFANGFGFEGRRDADFYTTMWIGALNYREPKTWKQLQQNGMSADFSWDRSAEQYD